MKSTRILRAIAVAATFGLLIGCMTQQSSQKSGGSSGGGQQSGGGS